MVRRFRGLSALSVILILAACGSGATTAPSPTTAPSAVAQASEAATPQVTENPCAAANLKTMTAGTLTVGADNPAYPPYYEPDSAAASGSPWELGDPVNGNGLEAATAYAIATKLGFGSGAVTWVVEPFNNAIEPGAKPFDMYLTQVSYSAERAQVVDLSDGYFDLNQAVVALKSNPIAQVTTVAGLKDFTFGTQAGTTSYQYITDQIQPTKQPRSYDSMDTAVKALQAKQIDAIVADLPTAFYMRDAQLTGGTIVGSLPSVGQVEHFSVLLAKGSPLTACVNQAIAALKQDGTLQSITDQWIASQGAPALK